MLEAWLYYHMCQVRLNARAKFLKLARLLCQGHKIYGELSPVKSPMAALSVKIKTSWSKTWNWAGSIKRPGDTVANAKQASWRHSISTGTEQFEADRQRKEDEKL